MNKIIVKWATAFLGCALLIGGAAPYYQPTAAQAASSGFETRCGWLDNPTPNNFWLYDKDGEWIISIQGGYSVEWDWEFPVFYPSSGCIQTRAVTATAAPAFRCRRIAKLGKC